MTEPGCGGKICRSCRPLIRRMTLLRYRKGETHEVTTDLPETGWVCGFFCEDRSASGTKLDLPGSVSQNNGEYKKFVVAAGSDLPLQKDDIIDAGTDSRREYYLVECVYKNSSARVIPV